MGLAVIIAYGLFLGFIFIYSLVQFNLVVLYLREKRKARTAFEEIQREEELPAVTIQLPVYNELYVVDRLIDSVCKIEYPRDRLEIQVLDDSSDETVELIARKVSEKSSEGFDIVHVRRPDRKGFKAGALAYGTGIAKGDFIAIFDADFVPSADFLLRTVPLFQSERVGVVQTRWEHLNEDYSLLTRLQAFGLDAHFSVEQKGRQAGGHFINFNGTAGIWRKSCIEDAGGWQSDTLTEDLDLSYRAQLRGWQFEYLEDLGSPAELPVAMSALKTQQYRWTKGAAECSRKNLAKVLRKGSINTTTKIHAIFHLLNCAIFVCVFGTAILSIPILFIKQANPQYFMLFNLASLLFVSLILLSLFYWVSIQSRGMGSSRSFGKMVRNFPLFLSVSMGLSLHNTIAVIEGWLGRKTPFVRTPKFNVTLGEKFTNNKYLTKPIHLLVILEGVLALYFLFGVILGFRLSDLGLLPFHLLLFVGFSIVFYYSVFQRREAHVA